MKIKYRKGQLSPDQLDQINTLYWDEGYFQYEIADIFDRNQPYISRLVNAKADGYFSSLVNKIDRLNNNVVPNKNEPKQARTLRAKRHKLPSTKLTWNQVVRIRELYFTAQLSQVELAARFNINQSTISRIIAGTKWKKI